VFGGQWEGNVPSEDRGKRPVGISRTLLVLVAVYLIDSWCGGQGIWSILVSLVGIVVLGVGALVAAVRGRTSWAASRALRALVYVLLVLATAATIRFHTRTAESRAYQVIEACKAYHAKHGAYPNGLGALVPEFLPSIPRAKYTMMWGEFSYWTSGPESHTLMYVAMPPFGRRLYNLETGRWGQLD
jgi:hypothetical protein